MLLLIIGSCFISHMVRFVVQLAWKPLILRFPPVTDTVNSSTSYLYEPRTRTYLQPTYASQTLQKFSAVNSQLLQSLKTLEDTPIEGRATIPKGTPLTDLITAGTRDQNSAPATLSALLEILGKQAEYVAQHDDRSCH